MMKTDLIRAAKISTNAMAKLVKNEDVRVGVLVKICETLGCKLDDMVGRHCLTVNLGRMIHNI